MNLPSTYNRVSQLDYTNRLGTQTPHPAGTVIASIFAKPPQPSPVHQEYRLSMFIRYMHVHLSDLIFM